MLVWAGTHHESLHGAGKRLDADGVWDEERPRRPAAGPKIPLANRFGQGYAALSPRGNHGQGIDKRNVCESHACSCRSVARKRARPQDTANGRHGIQLPLLHAHDALLSFFPTQRDCPSLLPLSFTTPSLLSKRDQALVAARRKALARLFTISPISFQDAAGDAWQTGPTAVEIPLPGTRTPPQEKKRWSKFASMEGSPSSSTFF